jgi:hypothetical protein
MPFARFFGVYNPRDLGTIQTVFDQLCVKRRLDQEDKHQREALASEVLQYYRQGLGGKADIWQSFLKVQMTQDSEKAFEYRLTF